MLYKYVGDNNIYTFIARDIQQQFSVGGNLHSSQDSEYIL